MLKMVRKLFCIVLLLSLAVSAGAQTHSQKQQKETEQFILKVLARYKNPMSYYPLRRDIFLPDEEEIAKDEFEKSYPEGARSLGHIVFLAPNDTTYHREPFVDADGDLLDLSTARKRSLLSLKSNSSYFKKKQLSHLNRYPSLGRFLYYNASFADTK